MATVRIEGNEMKEDAAAQLCGGAKVVRGWKRVKRFVRSPQPASEFTSIDPKPLQNIHLQADKPSLNLVESPLFCCTTANILLFLGDLSKQGVLAARFGAGRGGEHLGGRVAITACFREDYWIADLTIIPYR